MDILRPPTVWINGICYRKPFAKNQGVLHTEDLQGDAIDEYEEDLTGGEYPAEDDERLDGEIRHLDNGQFQLSFHVPSTFFALVIGKKGATRRTLEMETKTRIGIPNFGIEGDITVTGEAKKNVIAAHNRIQIMVASARRREDFTHFISIPLNSKEMKEAFAKFKKEVLEECSEERGIDETIFQDPGLLHLTIGTMVLLDQAERQKAIEQLDDCKERILLPLVGENAITVKVSGLEIMNDDPSEVDVVYAKVSPKDGSDVLQTLADKIVESFVGSGLMTKQYDRVKLHATLLNSLFQRDSKDEENASFKVKGDKKRRNHFDARNIIEKFGKVQFCQVNVDAIHLSQRRAARRTNDGYYLPSTILKFQTCG